MRIAQHFGARQNAMILRGRSSRLGFVRPVGYLDRRALRRLAARGVIVPAVGWPDTWKLVDKWMSDR